MLVFVRCNVVLLALLGLPWSVSAQCTVPASDNWRNTIEAHRDPFTHRESQDEVGWIKFIILQCDPSTVYFQDSTRFLLHLDFARTLPYFSGYPRARFDQVTLYAAGQEAVIGTVIMPPKNEMSGAILPEFAIQFVRQDPYPPQELVDLFNLVKAAVIAPEGDAAFYFPTYELQPSAEEHSDILAAAGVVVGSLARWESDNSCYSDGWALGELKYIAGDEIADAYRQGTLADDDILLTDGVPAEVPPLAGIITLAPAAGSSHVAILAQTMGTPFAHTVLDQTAAQAQALVGHTILLRSYRDEENQCNLWLDRVDEVLSAAQIAALEAIKQPQPLAFTSIASYGEYSASTENLMPVDICYFGGKAANFGLLRRVVPAQAPVAMAISFDLWGEYLEQDLASGLSLRSEIASRLSGHTYPPEIDALADELAAIRALFINPDQTAFTADQQAAILAALRDEQYQFTAESRLRFRSSTNVEDSELFSGAGLYDSFSGCLADELDDDAQGPSLCDPARTEERGVFLAIRKVFASFYNLNAVLARLRHGVAEDQVGMALLVHHSFPDETELANGVAVLEWKPGSSTLITMTLTTQLGAVSVANQSDGSLPEEVIYEVAMTGHERLWVAQRSNLVRVGETVMTWEWDYQFLASQIALVAEQYALQSHKDNFILDLEYKKIAREGMVIKQVRELPQPSETANITPFLVGAPTELCPFYEATSMGDNMSIFAQHRLKWRGTAQTASFWLDPNNFGREFFATVAADLVGTCQGVTLNGRFADFEQSWSTFEGDGPDQARAEVGFVVSDDYTQRTYRLQATGIPLRVSPAESPLVTLRDAAEITLSVDYEHPQLSPFEPGGTTSSESIELRPCPPVRPANSHQVVEWHSDDPALSITTSFYWQHPNYGLLGYTPPLARYDETVITGLTSEPIVLRSDFSQTYLPVYHTIDVFLFDPWLDPEVPLTQLKELYNQDIRFIHFWSGHIGFYQDEAGCAQFFPPLPRQPGGRPAASPR